MGCQGNCTIVAGSGVTVTGTGRASDPFVVSADGGSSGGFQAGDLKLTARASAPAGWLVCDGTAVSRSVYATLFAAIGTLFGAGDGALTFNLPDMRGRFPMGADTDHPRGSAGGDVGVTLTTANLPAHTHAIDHDHAAFQSGSAGQHDHPLSRSNSTGGATGNIPEGGASTAETSRNAVGTDGAHTHTVNPPAYTGPSGSRGQGTPVPFTPPYVAGLYVIKT